MYVKTYKELIVWQRAIELGEEIYRLTNLFPKSESLMLEVSKMLNSMNIKFRTNNPKR